MSTYITKSRFCTSHIVLLSFSNSASINAFRRVGGWDKMLTQDLLRDHALRYAITAYCEEGNRC